MSPLELVGDLGAELRAAKPLAPESLRERVRALEQPSPRWTFRAPSRRLVLGLVAAALLASFVAAGLTHAPGKKRAAGLQPQAQEHGVKSSSGGSTAAMSYRTWGPAQRTPSTDALKLMAPVLVGGGRLQRYDAVLRMRVDDVDGLSRSTQRAINLTRSLGGYVGSVQYATRAGKRGGATLLLRVPVVNVQTALAELSTLGTILQQRTAVLDVTRRADREAEQIANLKAALKTATPAGAVWVRHRLATLRAKHARLLKSAHFARITVGLTTPAKAAAAKPGPIDRTLDDAGSVLVRELQILLYALIVAGPLLLIGGAAIVAARESRRRGDRRLLERS